MPLDCCRERVGLCPAEDPPDGVHHRFGEEVISVGVLFERVAGLDIGKATLTVCVRTPGPRGRLSETRTFPTTTRARGLMRHW